MLHSQEMTDFILIYYLLYIAVCDFFSTFSYTVICLLGPYFSFSYSLCLDFFFLSGLCWLLKRHGDYARFQYSSTVYGMAKNNLFLDYVVKLILASNLGQVFFSFVGKYFIFDSFDFNIYDYSSFSILS